MLIDPLVYWTDGSCEPNPGPGGWAVILEGETVATGWSRHTTNNRMEGTAIREAIEHSTGRPALIMSDSELWVKTLTEWAAGWEKRGWRRKSGPIKNLDLVQEIWKLWTEHRWIWIQWVRGHDGNQFNEMADEAATLARLAGNRDPALRERPF